MASTQAADRPEALLLRDDSLSYADSVEKLTYLLFLKMAHERTQPPYEEIDEVVPEDLPDVKGWANLEEHYRVPLETLAVKLSMLSIIFLKS